ncbi:MAG: aldehyde dehydrogenase [Acidimicrobiales bacterium]|nr:aldehyde dehydrogenase [Acidimicrobiales bacterium]
MVIERRELFIDGAFTPSDSSERIEVRSPADGQIVGSVPEANLTDLDRAVAAARRAFDEGPWPRLTMAERAEQLGRVHGELNGRQAELAALVTEEVGTPISFSTMVQAMVPMMFLDYYVNLGRTYATEDVRPGMLGPSIVVQEPVGVVGAIVPWNYPFYLTLAKVAPALLAGCTVVIKPAPETPLDIYLLAEAVEAVGLPPGVLNVLPAGREVGEALVGHPGVDKISFTGSTATGRRIMGICAESVRRVTLELGGKSACILLDDADLDLAVPGAVQAATLNSGQTCVAQTRLLVPRARHDEVVERVVALFDAMVVGDPRDPTTTVGPMVSARQQERVLGYIDIGEREGAKVATGGGVPSGLAGGHYVEPTVFVGVDNGMRIAQEEIFGPVLAVIPYEGDDAAVQLANDSIYGLSGAVWSGDTERGVALARRIRTGSFAVNGLGMNLAAPFGGFKQSGIGRELGPEGLAPYLEYKSISVPGDYVAS